MRSLLVSLLLLFAVPVAVAQAPLSQRASRAVTSEVEIDAVAVRGTPELSAREAFAAARDAAAAEGRSRWLRRSELIAEELRPAWIPHAVTDRALQRELERQDLAASLRVVDREDRSREHEFGTSWQTTLWVAEDQAFVQRVESRLRRAMLDLRGHALAFLLGTAGLWAVLAVAVGWFDRLSRGYMTTRLCALGIAFGVAVPSLVFLL